MDERDDRYESDLDNEVYLLRAERDRLREEVEEERGVRDLVMSAAERAEAAWRAEHPEHGKFVIPDLAQHMVWCMNRVVELAPTGSSPHRLWSALAAENAGLRGAAERYLRATGRPASEEYLNQPAYLEAVAAHDALLAALTSPSPVTQAVQRVLAAVGECRAHPSCDWTGFEPLADAHDHLQALLEGKGESS